MKTFLFSTALIFSLYTQLGHPWVGVYELEIQFGKKQLPDSIKENIWTKFEVLPSKDSNDKLVWKANSYSGKKIWYLSGYAVESSENELLLFVEIINDIRKGWERKLNRRTDKTKPFYIIQRSGEAYSIKQVQGYEKTIALKKMN